MSMAKGIRSGGYFNINEAFRFKKNVIFDQIQNPLGYTYFVRNDGADQGGRSGLTTAEAFKTLAYANSRAAAWDKIIVLPATDCSAYLETELPIVVSKTGLAILGLQTSERQWGSPAIHTHSTTTLISVEAHQVEIGNLAFHMQGAGVSMQIGWSNSVVTGHVAIDPWRTHLHDCYFGGNGTALWGLTMGNTNTSGVGSTDMADAPCTTVERCFFGFHATGAIFMNCGYGSVVRECTIAIGTAGEGIRYYTDSSSRPFAFIERNRFTTIDATNGKGVVVTNTPTAGYLFIDGNSFNNFANAAACLTKHDGYLGANYCNGILITT